MNPKRVVPFPERPQSEGTDDTPTVEREDQTGVTYLHLGSPQGEDLEHRAGKPGESGDDDGGEG